MTRLFPLLSAVAIGVSLGLFYFWGLWSTLCRLPGSRHPIWWMMSSFLLRLLVILSVFYWVMDDHLIRLIITLLGFLVVRTVVMRCI